MKDVDIKNGNGQFQYKIHFVFCKLEDIEAFKRPFFSIFTLCMLQIFTKSKFDFVSINA